MHEDSPEDMVHDLFTETLWPGHPLGRPILGTRDRIKAAITRDRARLLPASLRARRVRRRGGRQRASTSELCAMLPSAWRSGRPLGARADPPKDPGHASSAQSRPGEHADQERKRPSRRTSCSARTGWRARPDRFAFVIVNTALGGGMSSRLFQEIREKRGLAYTAYSYHSQYTETGVFSAYAGTTPGAGNEVLDLMRRELDDVRDGGLTPRSSSVRRAT